MGCHSFSATDGVFKDGYEQAVVDYPFSKGSRKRGVGFGAAEKARRARRRGEDGRGEKGALRISIGEEKSCCNRKPGSKKSKSPLIGTIGRKDAKD